MHWLGTYQGKLDRLLDGSIATGLDQTDNYSNNAKLLDEIIYLVVSDQICLTYGTVLRE